MNYTEHSNLTSLRSAQLKMSKLASKEFGIARWQHFIDYVNSGIFANNIATKHDFYVRDVYPYKDLEVSDMHKVTFSCPYPDLIKKGLPLNHGYSDGGYMQVGHLQFRHYGKIDEKPRNCGFDDYLKQKITHEKAKTA